jgi:hypothetical protein
MSYRAISRRQSRPDVCLASPAGNNNAHLVSPIDAAEQLYHQYSPSAVYAPSIWTVFPRPLHGDDDDEDGADESHRPELLLLGHHGHTTTQPSYDGKTTSDSVLELLTGKNNADSAKAGGRTDACENLHHPYCLRGLVAHGAAHGRFSTASGHPQETQDSLRTFFLKVPDAPSTRVITQIESEANRDANKHHNNNNISINTTTTTMTASKQHLTPQSIVSSQEDQGGADDWFVGHAAPRSRSRAIAIKRTSSNHKNLLDHHHGEVATDDEEEAGGGMDQMYDYATWRMYHRIIDHRQKHPVPEDYHRPASSSTASSAAIMESSSTSAEKSAQLSHQTNDRLPMPSLRPKPNRVDILSDLDDVIFDMDF